MNTTPPIAKRVPHKLEKHGHVRIDPYYWLNDPEDEEVTQYLKEENKYTEEITKPYKHFQEQLFEEMKGRVCSPHN